MKFPYFSVNTICKGAYSGNPVGVCLLDEWLSTDELQNMASQLYLPECAFLFPGERNAWSIRTFIPSLEVDPCGHATLASAHVLYEEGILKPKDRARFTSNRGEFNGFMIEDSKYSVNFPLLRSRPAHISPGLVEALGAYPDEVHAGANVLCVFGNEEIITELKPDFRMLSGLHGAQGVIVTAKTSRIGYHFISRYFAPKVGIDEDHATGSAHCQLSWFWGNKLGKEKMVGFQASPRGAEIRCSILGNRVDLSGVAETFLRGKMIF